MLGEAIEWRRRRGSRRRAKGTRLTIEVLPLMLPKGWNFDALLGDSPPASADAAGLPEMEQEMDLPQTATGFLGALQRGLAMLALGVLGLVVTLRRGSRESRR